MLQQAEQMRESPQNLPEVQISFLYSEMKRLLNAYCFYADFPKGLPVEFKYRLLREKWDEEVVYTGEGMNYCEFCDYEPSRCPFPEGFCGCRDFDFTDDIDMDDFDDSNEMPF